MRNERVLVYGAAGHTGGFVVDELLRRGLTAVLAGRDEARLVAAAPPDAALDLRVVGLEDPVLLRRAVTGAGVVVNCAGPFLDTAGSLARAAVESGAHYLDVTAEQAAVQELYRELDAPARAAGVAVVPAMAFFGGLADLLLASALDGDSDAHDVQIAIGLDHWWPTAGTRATGARNTATRLVIRDGELAALPDPAPTGAWSFPDPFGELSVVQLPFSETITIHRHLAVGTLRSYLNTAPLADLRDPATPPPAAVDRRGRSAQRFVVEVVVRRHSDVRRITAVGRDIYATTAPIVVEGAVRLIEGRCRGPGAMAPAEAFDATAVLSATEQSAEGFTVRRDLRTGREATTRRRSARAQPRPITAEDPEGSSADGPTESRDRKDWSSRSAGLSSPTFE